MRASISKPTLFIYLTFEKTDPFIYLIIQNDDLWRRSSFEKSLSKKYVHIPGCQKNGAVSHRNPENRVIHILFVEKRGPIIYMAALKKGTIRHVHPHYAIYRKLPTPPTEGGTTHQSLAILLAHLSSVRLS